MIIHLLDDDIFPGCSSCMHSTELVPIIFFEDVQFSEESFACGKNPKKMVNTHPFDICEAYWAVEDDVIPLERIK